jgi:hypothetical protein
MPTERYVWQHVRDENIASDVEELIQALLRNYRMTDPSKGVESEGRKYEIAQQTIDLWWIIYDKLVFWAQAQIIGKFWTEQNLDFARELGRLWRVEDITESRRTPI